MNKGDDEQIEQKDQIEDEKEIAEAVKYTPLGGEQWPVDPEEEDIYYQTVFRIPKIENLGKF